MTLELATILGIMPDLNVLGDFNRQARPINDFQTDSRQVKTGSLFVALKGEKVDGHQFVEMAVETGASAILISAEHVDRFKSCASKAVILSCADTQEAFYRLSGIWRQQFSIPVICVAGSVGKTTTKELLAAALSSKYSHLHKTQASQNGFVGIPATLAGLRSYHEAAVIEVGIDEPGAMAKHLQIVNPTHAIVSAIGPEHLETMLSMENVIREERLPLHFVEKKKGMAVVNLDDPHLSNLFAQLKKDYCIAYTLETRAEKRSETGRILCAKFDPLSQGLTMNGLGLRDEILTSPLPGIHNARNLLGAVAVAIKLGCSEAQIKTGLTNFVAPRDRSQLEKLPNGTLLLADYYNANPTSYDAAFATLASLKESKHKRGKLILVMGDMLEMGPDEDRYHRELAPAVFKTNADYVLLFGPRMHHLKEELSKGSFSSRTYWFEDKTALTQKLLTLMHKDDILLLKGSRGMRMEDIHNQLK